MVYKNKKMFDEAISEFKKAISQDKNYWQAHYYLGQVYLIKGKEGRAIQEYTKAKNLTP